MQFLETINDVFFDPMLRSHDDWAQRDEMRVRGPAIIHGDREETGHTESLTLRIQLFQMPTKRFFAIVDAGDNLKNGP